jgi:glucokinase
LNILAADIGGTSSRFGWFEIADGRLILLSEKKYASGEFRTFSDILDDVFSSQYGPIDRACFGIAGPILRGVVSTPNLPWIIDGHSLAGRYGIPGLALINDLEANAWGIAELDAKDLLILNEGDPTIEGNAALISAGTGLGEAGLFFDGHRHRPFACEGGHADFAPRNESQADLRLELAQKIGHVSYERVLSGPGLRNIYDFLRRKGDRPELHQIAEAIEVGDAAAVIATAALASTCSLCVAALDMFVQIYGAEAGNVALKFMAVAGVYLGGGIAPKIVVKLKEGGFMDAFLDKGRLRPLLRQVPVKIILNSRAALLGAARCASLLPPQKGAGHLLDRTSQ